MEIDAKTLADKQQKNTKKLSTGTGIQRKLKKKPWRHKQTVNLPESLSMPENIAVRLRCRWWW